MEVFQLSWKVKAQRFSERVWATEATFNLNDSVITLQEARSFREGAV